MKLRILDNTVRLRLKRGELAELVRCGILSRCIDFGVAQSLVYTIARDVDTPSVTASFLGPEIRILIPDKMLRQWAASTEVGISADHQVGGKSLRILVEKDFACAHQNDATNNESFSPESLALVSL